MKKKRKPKRGKFFLYRIAIIDSILNPSQWGFTPGDSLSPSILHDMNYAIPKSSFFQVLNMMVKEGLIRKNGFYVPFASMERVELTDRGKNWRSRQDKNEIIKEWDFDLDHFRKRRDLWRKNIPHNKDK